MMNRIDATFQRLKSENKKGLVGYLTAGDPNPESSLANIRTAIDSGLDVLELGVPFSDPTADGPVIQEAAQRALSAGTNLEGVLGMVRKLREHSQIPVVLFGYVNPFFNYGYQRLCTEAASAGVDGILAVDLPAEETGEMRPAAEACGIHLVPLIAPTTSPDRARQILQNGKGFVYYIMIKGVTGAANEVSADVSEHVGALREITELPVAVGFGVGSGEQARAACSSADAVVVGSALIRASLKGNLGKFVRELRQSLDGE
jgi:tryptophan synthase alpha chain